jgi:FdhD protein
VVSQERVVADDLVTVEEPLEIRLVFGPVDDRREQPLAVTMRTPGNDLELTAGFLVGEGIVRSSADVQAIAHEGTPSLDKGLVNVVRVELSPTVVFDPERLTRHTFTTSSCGVCGKASLDAVRVAVPEFAGTGFRIRADRLREMPARLSEHQTEFARTGGLHASAIFDARGAIERVREDVGRHNALDKLIGSYLASGREDLPGRGLMLSGRTGFELVQKAAMVGIPLIAAIGPPSSLAIELAEECGMTLVGFLRSDRFNVYCGADRITGQ